MPASGCVDICPACPHRSLPATKSLARKQQWLVNRLGEFAPLLEPVKGLPEELRTGYRKKVCLAAQYNGCSWNIGIKRRDEVIPVHDCPVHNQNINNNIRLLSQSIPSPELFPLAWFMQSGAQLCLVVKCRQIPEMKWLDETLINQLQSNGVEGFWLHLFPSTGKKVTGKGGWHLIFGKQRSVSESGLIYGPSSFQQVLPLLYEEALDETAGFLKPGPRSMIIDLYCGTGASLRQWVSKGAKVLGIELGGEALECAAINCPEASLLRGACRLRIPQMQNEVAIARNKNLAIMVFANPPRTGLEREVAEWIAADLCPDKMAYLSCSAGTLHRDLSYLGKHGYMTERILPYDFFPGTLHVETLALISRQ